MPYFLTENFSAGIDTRKHPITAPSGTLRELLNCHITPGGEIEKRLAFVEAFNVSGSLTNSLMRVGTVIYVVSGNANPDETYGDLTLRYITGPTLGGKELLDWDVFDGRLYFTVITTADGTVEHYYQDAVDGVTASVVPDGKGAYIRTYQSKMYAVQNQTIYYSAVGDPTDWTTTANGAGFINAATNDAEAVDLQGIEVYYDKLAIFSSRAIQIWNMDPDPENNAQDQTVRSIGVAGRATPRQYGPGDILFLAPSGIRSLQARDSSNSASVSDVGSPIDLDIQTKIEMDPAGVLVNARTMLEDLTGRFWMMFSDEIFVLSLFPGPRVSAWSRYMPTHSGDTPFTPEDLVDAAGYVCVRASNGRIYVLGGEDRFTYDNCTAEFQMPYLGFEKPANWKQYLGFDAAVDGTWDIEFSLDPDNIVWEEIGTITKSTYCDQRIAFRGYSPACSIKMRSTFAGRARVANVALHYSLSKDD